MLRRVDVTEINISVKLKMKMSWLYVAWPTLAGGEFLSLVLKITYKGKMSGYSRGCSKIMSGFTRWLLGFFQP